MTSNSIQSDLGTLAIRRATTCDAATLAELAARTFHEAFAHNNPVDDMVIHLARSYGPPIQLAEINDPAIRCHLVEIDGKAVAYSQLRDGPAPDCVVGPSPYEIWRFYVDQQWHGRSIARRLMDHVINEARNLDKRTLWLGVWEHNPRAIAFYTKCGFTLVGDHGFLFADQMQTDLVMAKPV